MYRKRASSAFSRFEQASVCIREEPLQWGVLRPYFTLSRYLIEVFFIAGRFMAAQNILGIQ
jgi:hypothetical protein